MVEIKRSKQAEVEPTNGKGVSIRRPRISVDGLWTLLIFKTEDFRYLSVSDLPQDDREWAEENLKRIIGSISSDADFDRLLDLIDEVTKSGNALDALERLNMLF